MRSSDGNEEHKMSVRTRFRAAGENVAMRWEEGEMTVRRKYVMGELENRETYIWGVSELVKERG